MSEMPKVNFELVDSGVWKVTVTYAGKSLVKEASSTNRHIIAKELSTQIIKEETI